MPKCLLVAVRTVAIVVCCLAGGTAGLVGLTAGPAAAHARLISSDPAAGARLDARPAQVTLRFSEKIATRTALARVVVVVDDAETSYDPVAQVQGDRIIVPLEDVTTDGRYEVTYRVASQDGHPVEGTVRFRVVTPAEPDADGDPDGDQPDGDGPDGDGPDGDGPDGDGQGENGSDGDTETPLEETPTATSEATGSPTGSADGSESSGTGDGDDGSPPWLLLGGGLAVLAAAGGAVVLAARRRASPPAP